VGALLVAAEGCAANCMLGEPIRGVESIRRQTHVAKGLGKVANLGQTVTCVKPKICCLNRVAGVEIYWYELMSVVRPIASPGWWESLLYMWHCDY